MVFHLRIQPISQSPRENLEFLVLFVYPPVPSPVLEVRIILLFSACPHLLLYGSFQQRSYNNNLKYQSSVINADFQASLRCFSRNMLKRDGNMMVKFKL